MTAISWKRNVNGSWANAANWSGGVLPGSADDVTISTITYHTITHATGTDTIHSLTVGNDGLSITGGALTVAGSASIAQNLSVTGGTLALLGASSVGGSFTATNGTIALGSGAALALGGTVKFGAPNGPAGGAEIDGPGGMTSSNAAVVDSNGNQVQLTLGGGVTWTNTGVINDSGQIGIGDAAGLNATFVNNAGAVFDLLTDHAGITALPLVDIHGNRVYGAATFSNAGTLEKTGGSNVSVFDAAVNNTGLINVATGTIEFDGGGTFAGQITGAGQIAFGAGNASLQGGAGLNVAYLLIDGGTVTLSGSLGGVQGVNLSAGDLNLGSNTNTLAYGDFTQSGGTLSLNGGSLSLTNALLTPTNAYGYLEGPGTLTTNGTTSLATNYAYYVGGGLVWNNAGDIEQSGYVYNDPNSSASYTLNNAAGAIYDITNDSFIESGSGGVTQTVFDNAGLLAKTGGSGTSQIYALVNNTGTVSAIAGTELDFGGGGTIGGTLSGGGTIGFSGGLTTLQAGVVLNAAAYSVDGGTLTLGGNFSFSNAQFGLSAGGTIELGGNTLTLNSVALSGGHVEGAGTLLTTGNGSTSNYLYLGGGLDWTNTGTFTAGGDIRTENGGFNLVNSAGAEFDLAFNGYLDANEALATVTNAGLLSMNSGTNVSTYAFVTNTNTGTIRVAAANTLHLEGGSDLSGTLSGAGTLGFDSGNTIIEAGTGLSVGELLLNSGTTTFAASASLKSGQLVVNGGDLVIAAGTLSATGASFGGSGTIDGAGVLSTAGTTAMNNGAVFLGSNTELFWTNSGVVLDSGDIYTDGNGGMALNFTNQAGASFNITGTTYFAYDSNSTNSTFTNAGTLTHATNANSATTYFDATITSTGVVNSNSGTLLFRGGGSFAGALGGNGLVELHGSAYTLGSLALSANLAFDNTAILLSSNVTDTSTAAETANYSSFQLNGYTLTLNGGLSTLQQNNNVGCIIDGAGTLSTLGTSTIANNPYGYVQIEIGGGGVWNNAGTLNDGGQIQLGYNDGAGSLSNSGTIAFATDAGRFSPGQAYNPNGSTHPVFGTLTNTGRIIKTAGTATNHINAVFLDTGTLGTNSTGTISLDNGGALSGTILAGSHINLSAGPGFADGALSLGGGATLVSAATIDATGLLTLGDATKAATFTNSATYLLDGDTGIAVGSTGGTIVNTGLLEKSAGTGRSVIAAAIANIGTLLAASGTLAITGALTGAGKLVVGTGATLEIGTSVAATQAASFAGSTGTLALDAVSTYAGTISGLAVGDAIDLVNTAATSATLNASGQLVISNGASAVGTLNLAGTHTGDAYTLASDGHGGTLITLASNSTAWKGTTADWFATNVWTNGAPSAGSTATVSSTGTYTLSLAAGETANVKSLTLAGISATYAIRGLLSLGTGNIALNAGILRLSGTINGGTITLGGGSAAFTTGAVLDGTTYAGLLDMSGSNLALTLADAFRLTGPSGTGAGSITLTGNNSVLAVAGVDTLDNTSISIGSGSGTATLASSDPDGSGAVLLLGPNLALTQTGLSAGLSDAGGPNDQVDNAGTITAGVGGGHFVISGASFENDGIIRVSGSDDLSIRSQSFVNTGSISVTGATLDIGGTLLNTGSITTTNSALNFSGPLTTAQLLAIDGGGDVVSIAGTLDNTGSTFSVGTGTALGRVSLSGTISNGTIVDAGGGFSLTGTNAAIGNVAYQGLLDLSGANSTLSVLGTSTLSGAGGAGGGTISITGTNSTLEVAGTLAGVTSVNDTGGNSSLYYFDNHTLDAATVALGSAGTSYIQEGDSGTAGTLTLGSALVINQAGTLAEIYYDHTRDTVVNNGTINAGTAFGTFTVGQTANLGTFSNAGTIAATNGDTVIINSGSFANTGVLSETNAALIFGGSLSTATLNSITRSGGTVGIAGTLSNTGTTLTVGTGSVLGSLTLSGTITGGSIVDGGGGFGWAGGTLSGLTYHGTLDLSAAGANVALANTTIVPASGTGPASILLTGAGSNLAFAGTQSFDNAAITMGNATADRIEITPGSVVTLGAHTAITQTGAAGTIAFDQSNGTLIENGSLTISTGTLTIGYGNFTLGGSLLVGAGAQLGMVNATFTNLSGTTLSGGSIEVDANAVLQLSANRTITTLNSALTLSGSNSLIQSLSTATNKQIQLDTRIASIGATGTLSLLAGRSLTGATAFADAGLVNLGGGVLTETSIAVSAGAAIRGYGSIATAIANTGTLDARGGTLTLQKAVTGTGLLAIETGATLEIASTTAATEALGFAGTGGTLRLDTTSGFAGTITGLIGNAVSLPNSTITAASISGTLLTLALSGGGTGTYTVAGGLGNGALQISADGHTVYDYGLAQASAHTPEPVAFGNHHVGDSVSQTLSIGNAAPTGGYYEKLDAAIGSATAGFSAAGSFTGLVAGSQDNSHLVLSLNTAAAGTLTGSATISLSSDGTGYDSRGITSLGTQTVTATGGVYAYAAPTLSASSFNFGAVRVGGSVAAQTLVIGDGSAASAYQESLDLGLASAAGFLGSGTGTVSAGGTTGLSLSLNTAVAGDFSNTQDALSLASDGTAIGDGLGVTALPGQTITLSGKVYAAAVAQLAANVVNFGVVHVGDAANLQLGLTNGATGALADMLGSSIGSVTNGFGFTPGNVPTYLAAGASATFGVQLATTSSGSITGSASIGFTSHDGDLADLSLGTALVTLSGIVDNYALAAIAETSGGGSFSQTSSTSYTLDLGQVLQGSNALSIGLEALNAATGTADLLGGTLTASGAAAFANSGLGTFAGLGAGQADTAPIVTLSTSNAGTFTETITLASAGSNYSGYNGALATETISITGTVVGPQTIVLPSSSGTFIGGIANDTFIAATNTLVAGDVIDGAGGSNTLSLMGGGTFNLGLPATLANIASITALEGQAAGGGQSSTVQTITLRAGMNTAVSVSAGTVNGADPNGLSILINGAANAATITLGNGTDTVAGATATETVIGGTGTSLVQATAANATLLVGGQATGSTKLEITTAGTVTLNGADTYLTVKLDAASTLQLGGMGFITAIGSSTGSDTISAGAAGQTLSGNGGTDALNGYTGGGDTFLDTSKAAAGDTIANWTTGDVLDLTDMASATVKISGFKTGKLSITDGTHNAGINFTGTLAVHNFVIIGSDGHGGTLIGFHT